MQMMTTEQDLATEHRTAAAWLLSSAGDIYPILPSLDSIRTLAASILVLLSTIVFLGTSSKKQPFRLPSPLLLPESAGPGSVADFSPFDRPGDADCSLAMSGFVSIYSPTSLWDEKTNRNHSSAASSYHCFETTILAKGQSICALSSSRRGR